MSLTDTFDNPQSRVEAILQNAMGAEHEVVPQSRVEELLERLGDYLENIEGKITDQDEEIVAAVNAWLEDNPEATTTVQDGSITEAKLASALKPAVIKDYVTPQMYGAKGDGVTDDYISIIDAITESARTGKVLCIPAGNYFISQTIHLEDIPYTVIGNDYRYRIVIKGIDPRKCRFIFAESCTYGLYFQKGSHDYRGFTIDGIGIYTKAFTDTSMRPDFTGIYFESAPDTIIKNIWVIGCSYGIYIKGGWNTILENINIQYSIGAITFDGYNETSDAVGLCDNIRCTHLYVGQYPKEYGLKLKGVVNGYISNLDAEIANTASVVLIESSSNITIENFYIEWFLNVPVFKVSAIHTNNYLFIPKNIKITNGRIYRCDGYSFFLANCVNSEISYVAQVTNCNDDKPYDIGAFMRLTQSSDDKVATRNTNNINLFGNVILNNEMYYMTGQYSSAFNFNGQKIYYNPYYPNTYYHGACVLNTYTGGEPNTFWLRVTETGSFDENPDTTATGTQGEKKIIVADSSKIHVGTYIDVGTDTQLQVLRISGTTVIVHKALESNHIDEAVTIHNPVFTRFNKV